MEAKGHSLSAPRCVLDRAPEVDLSRCHPWPEAPELFCKFGAIGVRIILLDLHELMVAVSRIVVNHDGYGGTALDAKILEFTHFFGLTALPSYLKLLITSEQSIGHRLLGEKGYPPSP